MNGLILKMLNALTEEDKNLPAGSPLRACTIVAIPPLAEVTFDGANVLTITNDRKTIAEHILRDSAYLMTESGKTINTFTPSKIEVPQISQLDYLNDKMEWDKMKEEAAGDNGTTDIYTVLLRRAEEVESNFKNKKWDTSPLMRGPNLDQACKVHDRIVGVETHFKDFIISNDKILFEDEEGYIYDVGKTITLYGKEKHLRQWTERLKPNKIKFSTEDLIRQYLRTGSWFDEWTDPIGKQNIKVTDLGFNDMKPVPFTRPTFHENAHVFTDRRSGINAVNNLKKYIYRDGNGDADLGERIFLHTPNGTINTSISHMRNQEFEGMGLGLNFYKDNDLGHTTVYAVEFPEMK